jgi:hypothetical protein
LNIERKDYTARFVNEEDPIAAEKAFFDKLSAWWRAGRVQKPGPIPRNDETTKARRLAVMEPASGETQGTKGKWGGKVRFVGIKGERRGGDGRYRWGQEERHQIDECADQREQCGRDKLAV